MRTLYRKFKCNLKELIHKSMDLTVIRYHLSAHDITIY